MRAPAPAVASMIALLASFVSAPSAPAQPLLAPRWTRLVADDTPLGAPVLAGAIDERRDRLIVLAAPARDESDIRVRTLDLTGAADWVAVTPLGEPPIEPSNVMMYDASGDRLVFPLAWASGADSTSLMTLTLEEPMRWERIAVAGPGPGPRFGAVVAADPVHRRLLVHGGTWYRTENGILVEFFSRRDTWSYSLDEQRWTRISDAGAGTPPFSPAVPDQAYDPVRDRWVFGPRSAHSDSIRILDVATRTWSAVAAGAFEVSRSVWVYDPARDWILTFGGEQNVGDDPLHVLQLGASALWAYAPASDTPAPAPRYLPGFLMDAAHDRVVMFGEYPYLVFPDKVAGAYPATDAWLLWLSRDGDPGPVIPAGRLRLDPNPADRTTRASFRLARTQQVTFELYDVGGRLVHRGSLGRLSAGAHLRPLDLGGVWPSGVYFARLRLAEGDLGSRVAIVH